MFPLFTARCLHVRHDVRDPQRWKWEMWARMLSGNFAEMTTSTPFRDLLHAANLRHGTDGFTSPPKEGVLRIFSPLKIRWLRPGLNPRTWVLKASTLPLDHRSSLSIIIYYNIMGPPSYMRFVVDRNVFMQRIPVLYNNHCALTGLSFHPSLYGDLSYSTEHG